MIDVDALPDDEIHFTRVRSNPAQRRRTSPGASASSSNTREQPIVVYDSDEEVAQGLAGLCYLSFSPLTAFSHTSQATPVLCGAQGH